MKKLLSIILAAVMVLTLMTAFAACGGTTTTDDGGFTDDLGEGRTSERAEGTPDGIYLSRETAAAIPDMVAQIDKYIDGEIDGQACIDAINNYRDNLTFSMQQQHDIALKQNLDKVVMYIKQAMKEETAEEAPAEEPAEAPAEGEEGAEVEEAPAEPTTMEKIIEQRNLIASYLALEQR